ncbi:MAG: lipopolysaccharide heptosyltransferase II [Thermodesulfobacteria bacterium]|nr:lipopolysaccharide heptosyltransferase II [Thermodesulfobacteriota bacterium]
MRLPNWVGDAVMATPALLTLARFYPRLALVARPPLLSLFRVFPNVRELEPVEAGRRGLLSAARRLRGRFETGILFPNSFSSALLFFLARVKNRWGYRTDGRGFLLTRAVSPPKEKLHQRDYYLHLLEALGFEVEDRELRLFLSEAARQRAAALLSDLPPPRAGLAPGAAFGPAKKWPLSRFRALAYHLRRKGFSLVILGGAAERAAGEELARDLSRTRNLCGLTDLATAAAIIETLDLFVSNDSGLMHVAAALKRPQVAIFGSTDPEATGPLNPRAKVVRAEVPCSPCLSRTCARGYECFEKIQVSDVLRACLEVTRETGSLS